MFVHAHRPQRKQPPCLDHGSFSLVIGRATAISGEKVCAPLNGASVNEDGERREARGASARAVRLQKTRVAGGGGKRPLN